MHSKAYAPLCRVLAKQSGLSVVLLDMEPWRLATLKPSRAISAMHKLPDVRAWTVGGHGMGGCAAQKVVEQLAASNVTYQLMGSFCTMTKGSLGPPTDIA